MATTKLSNDEVLDKLNRLITLTETNIQLQLESQKIYKSIDWKLWEILKISKSFSIDMNVDVKDHFND